MNYTDIRTPSSKYDRVIRVYQHKCILNGRACSVFYNPATPRVGFRTVPIIDSKGHPTGAEVYIGAEREGGYRIIPRKGRNEAHICSIVCNAKLY